jgi:hypothetical protein
MTRPPWRMVSLMRGRRFTSESDFAGSIEARPRVQHHDDMLIISRPRLDLVEIVLVRVVRIVRLLFGPIAHGSGRAVPALFPIKRPKRRFDLEHFGHHPTSVNSCQRRAICQRRLGSRYPRVALCKQRLFKIELKLSADARLNAAM